ncbi:hypothetical protein [Sphingomonas sp.]|uniref:hypothetical protein n=1 Tax=Sphingomonas sp. TaxID=28214 RepID=UPI001ED0E027|nr:hypothetical protein [Sphingomonas sp.]MBX3593811.1 hypothetical protein [Sphingomonas sp.]
MRARLPKTLPASVIPNLKSAFSLTPAQQSVSGRGSMRIDGKVIVPNPLPPGFNGQATVTYRLIGIGTASWVGGVFITLKAQKDVFYAIDCLASVSQNDSVDFTITGAGAPQSGKIRVEGGHIVLNARRTVDTGDVSIMIRPETYVPSTNPFIPEKNVMDFWGCQISSA